MKTRIIGAVLALVLAVVGAFILVTYVRGADARAAAGTELEDVYVVEEAIPEGTPGENVEQFVTVDTMPARNVADGAVTDLADLAGLVADAQILPGEQLLEARFLDPAVRAAQGSVAVPPGMQEVSFALPVARTVGGAIRPGDTVGLVTTKYVPGIDITSDTPTFVPETWFQFDGVLVTNTQIGTTSSSEAADGEITTGDKIMLTVALNTHDAERLIWAMEGFEHSGAYIPYVGVWVTLQNEAVDTSGSSPVDESNLYR
ncbi:hypothetical protein J7E29_04360 [Streptomyces sp. ISL-90]|nr:hypothetical protein [Streptomyces sp. ISL-90]